MGENANNAESKSTTHIHRPYYPLSPLTSTPAPSITDTYSDDYRDFIMAVAAEPLTPSNHLPLEPTGLTPGFGGTPGFFSAEFGAINPFEVDFHDATASPLRVETSSAPTPPGHSYFPTATSEIPRSSNELAPTSALRRNYDPSLVPTPGPRLSGLTAFKPSALKESTTIQDVRSPPSPREKRSPEGLNPAFLGPATTQFPLSTGGLPGYGSSRGIHGEFTPPTDESRSP